MGSTKQVRYGVHTLSCNELGRHVTKDATYTIVYSPDADRYFIVEEGPGLKSTFEFNSKSAALKQWKYYLRK